MKKRLFSMVLLIVAIIAIMYLISWALSGDSRERQNREFQERVLQEQRKMQNNIQR